MSSPEIHKGTVIAAYRKYTLVEGSDAQLYQCQQRKTIGQVVCGDVVDWQDEDEHSGVITAIKERNTVLQRPDINGKLRVIAANIDQVFIVVTNKPELNEGLIDRYLVAAENSHLKPIIVLNKIDLLNEQLLAEYQDRLSIYEKIGYKVIYTSAKQEHGLDSLVSMLHDNNNIFVGQSGVGKSSLINSILEDANAQTGEISDATGKGKHTTTTAYLYPLKNSLGHIIDSPGVREFGLIKLSEQEIADGFIEFEPFIGHCKFRNCAHKNEPGCALLNAVKNNQITVKRWESYQRIVESVNENNH